MKITLAVICGNVEHYMPRFLDSFMPFFDEVVVVRAIGSQTPDVSLELAQDRGCTIAIYHNKTHPEWEHVDDFAAARNLAWKLAEAGGADYVAWADTDDVFDCTQSEWSKLRQRIAERRPDVITLPYEVPEDQLCVLRERIVKAGQFHWVYPIHENLVLRNEKQICDVIVEQRPRWKHQANFNRQKNDERNLRILEAIPVKERTLSQLFHLWQSMRAVGRVQEGLTIAHQALKHPDCKADEGYELLINIAQVATNPRAREQHLLQALNAVPWRREAYGEMVNCKLSLGDPKAALAYAQAMQAIPKPDDYIWNARGKYYGYLATQLYGMALRANMRFAEADVREINELKSSGRTVISLLHATRGRPQLAAEARRMWLNRATHPDRIEHIFAVDFSDEASVPLTVFRHVVQSSNNASVGAWNLAAKSCCGEIMIQINDDFEPPLNWDTMIEFAFENHATKNQSFDLMNPFANFWASHEAEKNKPAVLRVSDGHRKDDLLCIAIINRARYEQQGFFLHPSFKSVFSDDYHTWLAKRDSVIIDAKHIIIEHNHPFFNGGKGWDETYAIHNSEERYIEGKAIFEKLTGETVENQSHE